MSVFWGLGISCSENGIHSYVPLLAVLAKSWRDVQFFARVEDIVIYHFFYGAWLEAEVAMHIEVKDRETFDIFYNTSCGREPQACEERRKQRIQDHLAANRRGDVRNHTERECISLPYEDLEPVVM